MNILLSGPFGLGSLSDEIVLAGVLKPLLAAKHHVTVLTADRAATSATHSSIETIELRAPTAMLSTPAVYKALDSAHFFGLCGAGVISDKGKLPARSWLSQLESARQMKVITAVIGAGAIPIEDRKEQVRVQRFLHHFADSISVRDDASKLALIECGLNANRISVTGDPTLALGTAGVPPARTREAKRIAFFFTDGVPSRQTFPPEPTYAPSSLAQILSTLIKDLSADGLAATIFHDSSRQNLKLANSIAQAAPQSTTLIGPEKSIPDLIAAMSACSVAITDTLHGLLFAAAHSVPAIYLNAAGDAPAEVAKLDLSPYLLHAPGGSFDPAAARALITQLAASSDTVRTALHAGLTGLAKKEAQNARMIERLVPKRLRYARK